MLHATKRELIFQSEETAAQHVLVIAKDKKTVGLPEVVPLQSKRDDGSAVTLYALRWQEKK